MEAYYINDTDNSFFVRLDKNQGIFAIGGRSIPEDAISAYTPIIEWLSQYASEPNTETIIDFSFEYINSSSMKQIAKILSLLNNIKSTVKVIWHYHFDDFDSKKHGERLSQLVSFSFILVPDATK